MARYNLNQQNAQLIDGTDIYINPDTGELLPANSRCFSLRSKYDNVLYNILENECI